MKLSACPALDGRFGAVNADDFYGRAAFEVLADNLGDAGGEHVLVTYPLATDAFFLGEVDRILHKGESLLLV